MDEVPRFAADRMVARLARWLRLMGADVLYQPDLGGGDLLRRARAEDRMVLTRDKRLRTAPDVLYLHSNSVREQLIEVLRSHPFDPRVRALTRCSSCNLTLQSIDRALVASRVPPFVFATQQRFALCPGCGKIYWEATHVDRMRDEIEALAAHGANS